MQYLKKSVEPPLVWRTWFTGGAGPCYVYDNCRVASDVKEQLLREQSGLCAYCQSKLSAKTASIEHVIPQSFNNELSTNYYNLVAVCKSPPRDPETGKLRCDKERGSQLMLPLIFHKHFACDMTGIHPFFDAVVTGKILINTSAPTDVRLAAEQFCEKVNINHNDLVKARARLFTALFASQPAIEGRRKQYWQDELQRIRDKAPELPHRQFLMMLIRKQILMSKP